jgi:hypothetical protein
VTLLTQWEVPAQVWKDSAAALASAQHEIFLLWTAPGELADGVCRVARLIIPEQMPETSAAGVSVLVPGHELARIAFDNYQRGERSVVQLHTHPRASVEMSLLDREREVVRHVGGLSIIVPHYGRDGLAGLPGVNVYEREESDWRLWDEGEGSARLVVVV